MNFSQGFFVYGKGAAIACLALISSAAHAFREVPVRATIETGQIEGVSADGLDVFAGIPYAAPPVGELRWRAPLPPAPWSGIRPAREFGPACPQKENKEIAAADMSEDCLTINIWSPAVSARTNLPVMVWLHGGGFNSGSSRLKIYDGANLASKGVVVVTLNYRLGYLGFFGHPQLSEEARAESVPTANYGLLDQIAALQWVKRNIAAFGGDTANVTLFGESAGAVSILALMTAPAAQGLFHKAIIQSGGGRWVAPTLTRSSGRFPAAYEYGEKAARAFGLKFEEALSALRRKSWQEIRDTLSSITELADQTPFLDGTLLTEQIEPVFARGAQSPIPIIVGANSYEGVLLRSAFKVSTKEVLQAVGPQLDELSQLYPPQLIMTRDFLADHIWGDANFVEPARMIARHAARSGRPVYHYCFDFQPPLLRLLGGTPHGLEVVYAFGNLRLMIPFPLSRLMHSHNYEVSRLLLIYWTNFAKTGSPNQRGVLNWPRFAEHAEETLVFGNDGLSIERDYLKERLDLFKGVVW